MNSQPKIVVLDDDPTGSQTVHGCLLLMRWDVETLRMGLRDESPIFFILTNTRSLTPGQAAAVTRDVCVRLKEAIAVEGIEDYLVVSRSDSTLRGHYPIETDVIATELGPFDAHFLVPAFFEGGRFTRDSIHYLMSDGLAVPVHETEFADDSVFAYSYSYLPDYVAEKTRGKIAADDVERILLEDLRRGVSDRLIGLQDNQCVVVDGETQEDLDRFARDVLAAVSNGKKFLFRSAASVLTSLAALPPQPVAGEDMSKYVRDGNPGVAIVGSHVQKTTQQLERLLQEPGVAGVEVDVSRLLEDLQTGLAINRKELLNEVLTAVRGAYTVGKTPVVYTSRDELTFEDVQTRLDFGAQVSSFLMDIVHGLPENIGFLISKGGITSNDVLSKGLMLRTARLLGQILAGCSVVRTPAEHLEFPNLPVVLFPGNVGDREALATVYRRLAAHRLDER
ncbi:MAG: four-carbon acid sugar kinase family protein [Synechococcus sp.]